jgi:hypothetical protein
VTDCRNSEGRAKLLPRVRPHSRTRFRGEAVVSRRTKRGGCSVGGPQLEAAAAGPLRRGCSAPRGGAAAQTQLAASRTRNTPFDREKENARPPSRARALEHAVTRLLLLGRLTLALSVDREDKQRLSQTLPPRRRAVPPLHRLSASPYARWRTLRSSPGYASLWATVWRPSSAPLPTSAAPCFASAT